MLVSMQQQLEPFSMISIAEIKRRRRRRKDAGDFSNIVHNLSYFISSWAARSTPSHVDSDVRMEKHTFDKCYRCFFFVGNFSVAIELPIELWIYVQLNNCVLFLDVSLISTSTQIESKRQSTENSSSKKEKRKFDSRSVSNAVFVHVHCRKNTYTCAVFRTLFCLEMI